MKKKIVTITVLAVLMLITISLATAISTNITNTEPKESPLYGLRTRRAITEKIGTIIENIKTKFLGDRIFFIPFSSLYRNDGSYPRGELYTKVGNCACGYTNMYSYPTCEPTCGYAQMNTICGDCTSDNCETWNTETCRAFCIHK